VDQAGGTASRAGGTGSDDSPWLRPGRRAGLPWLFTLACLTVLPVAVYIVLYAPWVELGNAWGLPLIGSLPFMPVGSETGQTLAELTASMYQYHDGLRASHAASSPWWAWPLDLKPVWFFSERYAGSSTGLIYDTGNLVVFWLGIAGMGFASWAAWHRRSLSLTVLVILWAALWLPWARIDRATFQYHVYASLPFVTLALAYFLAELWHGPSPRTWFLARAAAALAILAAPLMWLLLRTPLCILAGTATANPGSAACAAEVSRASQLSQGGMAAMACLALGAVVAIVLLWRATRRAAHGRGAAPERALAWLVIVGLLTLGGVIASLALLDTTSTTAVPLSSDVLALAGLVVMALPASVVLRARDPRRFVLGVGAAALLWLLAFYPNLAGLPLPADLAYLYQRLLPTWDWSFQFAVNTDPAVAGGFVDLGTLVVAAVTLALVLGAAMVARRWSSAA
jgi:hypothetical protein